VVLNLKSGTYLSVMITTQPDLFAATPALPPGMRYATGIVSVSEEKTLLVCSASLTNPVNAHDEVVVSVQNPFTVMGTSRFRADLAGPKRDGATSSASSVSRWLTLIKHVATTFHVAPPSSGPKSHFADLRRKVRSEREKSIGPRKFRICAIDPFSERVAH
jgi:hypothetical protein